MNAQELLSRLEETIPNDPKGATEIVRDLRNALEDAADRVRAEVESLVSVALYPEIEFYGPHPQDCKASTENEVHLLWNRIDAILNDIGGAR